MKNRNNRKSVLAFAFSTALGLTLLSSSLNAQDPAVPAQPVSASSGVPQLSAGVPQVLQLLQARVGESTILAYVKNSGMSYRLNAEQIIYLKQQGASNAILDAMLNHQPTPTAVVVEPASTVVARPTVTYVQTAPSTVYVAPRPYYYPAYYSYPAYYNPWPPVSLSFGFGGHGHWGGHHYGHHHGRH